MGRRRLSRLSRLSCGWLWRKEGRFRVICEKSRFLSLLNNLFYSSIAIDGSEANLDLVNSHVIQSLKRLLCYNTFTTFHIQFSLSPSTPARRPSKPPAAVVVATVLHTYRVVLLYCCIVVKHTHLYKYKSSVNKI